MKYRKKPVTVEAMQWTGDNIESIGGWMRKAVGWPEYSPTDETITIHTLEGNMVARKGDWIIKGVSGEFYPCKPDIFNKTYEAL